MQDAQVTKSLHQAIVGERLILLHTRSLVRALASRLNIL